MKYRLPDDCIGIAHAGVAFTPDADGLIEADESLLAHLAPHGVVAVDPDEPEKKGDKAERRRSSR